MLFLFKPRLVVVDAFTDHAGVYEHGKFDHSSLHYPKWWKSMPPKFQAVLPSSIEVEAPTMATCAGFLDLYNNSYTLPLWSDLTVKVTPELQWASQWADQENATTILSHDPRQYNNSFPDKVHLKISSPWYLTEKTGVNFSWAEPTWHMAKYNPGVTVLPGIVNYRFQSATHVNMLLDADTTRQYKFEHLQPMVCLIPLTDKAVDIRHHLVSTEEIKHIRQETCQTSFLHTYLKRKKRIESGAKCPFH